MLIMEEHIIYENDTLVSHFYTDPKGLVHGLYKNYRIAYEIKYYEKILFHGTGCGIQKVILETGNIKTLITLKDERNGPYIFFLY